MYQDKALLLSDLDATNFELEQTALEDSMRAFAAEQGRKQRARIFAGSLGGGAAAATAAASATAEASRSSRQRRGRDEDAFLCSSSDGPAMATPHASLVPAAASSTTVPTAMSLATSSHAAHSPVRFATDPDRTDTAGGFGALDAMEYPETVQELVMNGFELSRVVRAYELIGDSFGDLFAFLMSQQQR